MPSQRNDVRVHAAVTILDTARGAPVIGDKPREVCQYAADFNVPKTPTPEKYVRQAFDEMREKCVQDMRRAGLIAETRGFIV